MDINLERYHKSFEIGSNKETLLKMLYMPKRQFGLFTVNIDSMFGHNEYLFQTFADAFDYISKEAKGNEIFEIKSCGHSVTYTFICYKSKYCIRFATATIYAHLFTYDENKPLATHDYMWNYDEDYKRGHLQ